MGCVEQDGRAKKGLRSLWLLRSDWTVKRVSAALGVHYTTVQRWVKWYRTGGLDKMASRRRGGYGRQPYLDDDDLTLLAWEIKAGAFDTAEDVRDWIETQCGVRYTMPGVYSLMKRLKYRDEKNPALPSHGSMVDELH